MPKPLEALIIAAGYGSRLADLSPSKPLTPVAGVPLNALAERQAMAEYHHSAPMRCADDCLSVMQSALAGRVQHLFVSRGAHMTGNVQRLAGRAALEGYVFRNDNLVNAAAVETLLHKGSVSLVTTCLRGQAGRRCCGMRASRMS